MGCCGAEEFSPDNSGAVPDKVLLSSRSLIEIENKEKIYNNNFKFRRKNHSGFN